jgi:hypothetical protein
MHAGADVVPRVGTMYSGYLALRAQLGVLLVHMTVAECTEASTVAEELQKQKVKDAEQCAASVPPIRRRPNLTHPVFLAKVSLGALS